jgi:hypothetical protein
MPRCAVCAPEETPPEVVVGGKGINGTKFVHHPAHFLGDSLYKMRRGASE